MCVGDGKLFPQEGHCGRSRECGGSKKCGEAARALGSMGLERGGDDVIYFKGCHYGRVED